MALRTVLCLLVLSTLLALPAAAQEPSPEEAAVDDGIGAGAGPHRAHLGTFVHRDSSDLETHPSTSSHAVRLVNTLADFRATCAKP